MKPMHQYLKDKYKDTLPHYDTLHKRAFEPDGKVPVMKLLMFYEQSGRLLSRNERNLMNYLLRSLVRW